MKKLIPKTLLSFILHFLQPHWLYVSGFILCAMISGLYEIINLNLTKTIINLLENTAYPEDIISLLLPPAILLVINFEVQSLTWRGMGYINYKVQPVIKSNIISQTFAYVCKHSHQFFQDNLAGKISSNINALADNTERAIHDIFRHIIRGVVLLAGSLVTMYFIHPFFFCGLFVWAVCFCAISYFISKNTAILAEAHAESETRVSGYLVDSLSNVQNIRIFSRYEYEYSYILKILRLMKQTFQKKEIFMVKLHLIQGFSVTIMLAFMLYTLIRLRIQGLVTMGDFALILGLSIDVGFTLCWAAEQIDHLNNAIGKCKQSLKALFTMIEIPDKPYAKPLVIQQGVIIFDKVKFHYKGTKPLFQNQSVTIAAGERVGLVGYSGSGKTTFVNLILRLYDVTKGRILIDGQDIRKVTQDSLRDSISIIPQDPSLFHRSMMDNIRYGRIDASDKEVIEASKKAHVHEFVSKLSHRYESLAGERGIKLSGGQRQRIAIARAILKNAPILILDEATSQLDSVTESDIQECLDELMKGKTTLVIAHRLSTLLHMDRILVFERGKIIEDGTHKELLSKGRSYKSLWDAQVGGFLPE